MIFWQVAVINSLIVAVIVLSVFQFTNKRLKLYFVTMVVATAAYINPVILTGAGFEKGILEIISRLVFFFGALTVVSMAAFLLVFAKPTHLRKVWFLAAQGLVVLAGLLSLFSDLIVAGVDVSGPRPIFGPFQAVYQALLAGDFLAALVIFAVVGFRAQNSLLRYQMRMIGGTFTVAMILMMSTNLVAPLVTGNHSTARLGPLWLLLPIIGIFRVVANAKRRELFLRSRGFIDQHLEIAESVGRILAHESHAAVIHFNDVVKIELKNLHTEPREYVSKALSPKLIQGLIADKNRLAGENLQLSLQVERIRQINREIDTALSKENKLAQLPVTGRELRSDSFSPAKEGVTSGLIFDEQIPYLLTIAEKNLAVYGQEMICVSREFFEQLAGLEKYARSRQPLFIEGEAGSGKAVLARSAHFLRTGKHLTEISCYSLQKQKLRHAIIRYLADSSADKGLLIRHIDYLEAEDLMLFYRLLSETSSGYVYFTAPKDFLNPVSVPEEIFSYLNQLVLSVVPLRKRPDDIACQLAWYAHKHATILGIPYDRMSENFMRACLKYGWPGNSRELISMVQKALVTNQPPVLEKIEFDSHLPDMADESFGPLEAGERRVISDYLRKNKYNKNRTRIQLGITVNTLNAKISKYKIGLPQELT